MQIRSLLLPLALGLVSASTALSEDSVLQNDVQGQVLARSATSPHKDTIGDAKHHFHKRSGAHEQQAEKPNPISRSKMKRQSGFYPDSYMSNPVGNVGPDNSPIVSGSSGQYSGNTGASPSTSNTNTGGNNPAGGNIEGGNTGSVNTGTGGHETGGNCNNNPSPNGCAHEDGPSTGDPGWTCGSGGSNNNQLSSRDLTSLRFNKRQNTPSYVQTMNTWRCKFCLPPLAYDSALEQSAQNQGANSASQGAMVETPPNGQGTVMAEGGGPDFETAVLFWICEVHTTNLDSCTCANAYSRPGFHFTWTERGHYDFLVGKQAGQFGSIGCAYNDAMGGLWTCALGMK